LQRRIPKQEDKLLFIIMRRKELYARTDVHNIRVNKTTKHKQIEDLE